MRWIGGDGDGRSFLGALVLHFGLGALGEARAHALEMLVEPEIQGGPLLRAERVVEVEVIAGTPAVVGQEVHAAVGVLEDAVEVIGGIEDEDGAADEGPVNA